MVESKKLKVTSTDKRYSVFLQVYQGWFEESDSEEDESDGDGPQAWIIFVADVYDFDMEDDTANTRTFTQHFTDAKTFPNQSGILPEILHHTLKDNTW